MKRMISNFLRSPGWQRSILVAILRNRIATLGLALVLIFVIIASLAGVLSPYNPNHQDYDAVMLAPNAQHIMGTDDIGRDQFSRVIYGARISLTVAFLAMAVTCAIGIPIGLVAGYYGGWVDELAMRVMDALWSFPSLLLALAISAALGKGIGNLIIALGTIGIASMARIVRGQVLFTREMEFVTAARASGASVWRIIRVHIWPNVTTPVMVTISLGTANAILSEASLSFLGIGVQPPEASWGVMLRSGYQFMEAAVWLSIFPGLAIFLAVLGLVMLGDGLQIMMDPRLRGKRRGS